MGATVGAATLLLRLLNAEPCHELAGVEGVDGDEVFVMNGGIGAGGNPDAAVVGETYGLGPWGLMGVPHVISGIHRQTRFSSP